MARTSGRRWKGCQLCKPWKHAGQGDAVRIPPSVLRATGGRTRRITRRSIPREDS
jgi:hypothetical protein